ncbi:probable protein SYM1 [Coccomyxa sp. Obi]|nr:probable protein SYM1 [Coccomyxa sp. Obi]
MMRTARFAAIGFFLHAPIADAWFTFLEQAVYPETPASMQAVLAKMALDQCIMAPLFLLLFFFATKTLEGQPHKLLETIREKYLKTVLIGYIIWPLAHIINFKFVPNNLRILYVNIVQVGWNVILCRLSSTSAARLPEHKKYIERKVSQHLGAIEIAEKRKSLPRLSTSAFRGTVSPP